MFDFIIVGAGFAGSVMANLIATKLDKKVLIIEKRDHIGGNCFDNKDDNNILIHKYGPHLFHTDNKNVWDYLSSFTKWDVYFHEVLAQIDGKKVPIPFNLNTIYEIFPSTLASKLEEKLLANFKLNSKVPILDLKKSTDKDLQFLADFVYEKVFVNYTSKQWNLRPEDMDSTVTARVPIFIGRDDRYFNDTYQAVPSKGYSELFNKMLNHQNIKLMLNTNFNEVAKLENGKVIFFDKKYNGKVIYTGQIDELFGYEFGELPYRSVDMRFETIDVCDYQKVGTVNYPNNFEFTRITEFKKIHPINSNKTTILKEYPQEYKRGQNTPYYPIFTEENQAKYNKYVEASKTYKNIIMLGRLAEYKYYDMDDIVARAMDVFEVEIAK